MASGAFGKSFETAFISGAKSGSDAALDAIKDKIKKESESARETQKTANYLALAAELGKSTDPVTQEKLAVLIGDKAKEWDSESAKSLFELAESGIKTNQENAKLKLEIQKSMFGEGFRPATPDDIGKSIVESNMRANKSGQSSLVTLGGQSFVPMQSGNQFKDVFMAGQEGLTNVGRVSKTAHVFREALTPEQITAREYAKKQVDLEMNPKITEAVTRAKEEVELEYPDLNEKQRDAVAAYRYINPKIEKFNKLVDDGLFKNMSLVKQITVDKNGQLVVPDGSPLEEAIGLVNSIKLTGFNIAGAAFTGTEKEVAFTLLNPVGKSDKQIKADMKAFSEIFRSRIETGVEGLKGARDILKNSSESSTDTSVTKFDPEKEARYQAWKASQK